MGESAGNIDNLLKSIIALSKKLIIEIGDFYPLFHYMKNNEITSTTVSNIFDSKFDSNEYYNLILTYSKKNNIKTYAFSENVSEKAYFKILTSIDGIEYDFVYVCYKKVNQEIVFSDLITKDSISSFFLN